MKKRLVAVMLSLFMCTATVSEAGAATFTSPDVEAAGTAVQEENAESGNTQENPTGDFSSGETDDSVQDLPDGNAGEDVFNAGTDETTDSSVVSAPTEKADTDAVPAVTVDAEGTISVKAEDWVQTAEGFKLRKAQSSTEDTQIPAAEQNAENNNDADVSEVDGVAAATDMTSGSAGEISDQTEEDSQNTDPVQEIEVVQDAQADQNTDADIPAEKSADESYYSAEDGILKISTEYKNEIHTGYYLFDENGLMIMGQASAEGDATVANAGSTEEETQTDQLWFTTEDDAVLYTGCEGEALTPYTSTIGQQLKNTWVWTGTVFKYYNAEGVHETVAELEKKAQNAGTYTGYFEINGEYYCLDENGTPKTGNVTITVNGVSSRYYFEPESTIPGRMFHEGWRCIPNAKGDRWVYYNQGVKEPKNIGKYYEHGIMATTLGTSMGEQKYLIDKSGYLLKNAVKKAADGYFYATDKNGAIYINTLVKYKNNRYYFGKNGRKVSWKNRWARVGNHYYYFGAAEGRVSEKHGWQKLYNTSGKFLGWLYFDANGNHYTNKTTSEGYYFTPSGKLASGLVERDGKKYLYEVSTESVHKGKLYKNTMILYKNRRYLASSTGALYKDGWRKYSGNWYCLKNYVIQTKQFMKKNGVNGYLDANGKYTTGWVIVSNARNLVRYIDPDGNGFAKNTSKRVNGVLYYFDSNGYRITDVTNRYSGPYYLELEQVNGVMTVYTDSSKTIPVKTIRVSVGRAGTNTPNGTFTLRRSARWQSLMGPSWGQYGTHVENAGQGGIFVHSVACGQANSYNLPAAEYNKLGYPASHGCIRACVADAKWVYDNCNGATIHIINGVYKADDALKGPLGKKPLTPLRGSKNFDPTDPAVRG